MTPLRDTMGLIYGEEGDGEVAEKIEVLLFGQGFRGNIQQLGFSRQEVLPNGFYLPLVEGGVQEVGHFVVFAVTTHEVHLIFHQGDEGRYNDGTARTNQCRQLVAEAFSTAGGHDDKGISAAQQAFDGLLLGTPEFIKAKVLLEGGMYYRVGTLCADRFFCGGLFFSGCCLLFCCGSHVCQTLLQQPWGAIDYII